MCRTRDRSPAALAARDSRRGYPSLQLSLAHEPLRDVDVVGMMLVDADGIEKVGLAEELAQLGRVPVKLNLHDIDRERRVVEVERLDQVVLVALSVDDHVVEAREAGLLDDLIQRVALHGNVLEWVDGVVDIALLLGREGVVKAAVAFERRKVDEGARTLAIAQGAVECHAGADALDILEMMRERLYADSFPAKVLFVKVSVAVKVAIARARFEKVA